MKSEDPEILRFVQKVADTYRREVSFAVKISAKYAWLEGHLRNMDADRGDLQQLLRDVSHVREKERFMRSAWYIVRVLSSFESMYDYIEGHLKEIGESLPVWEAREAEGFSIGITDVAALVTLHLIAAQIAVNDAFGQLEELCPESYFQAFELRQKAQVAGALMAAVIEDWQEE